MRTGFYEINNASFFYQENSTRQQGFQGKSRQFGGNGGLSAWLWVSGGSLCFYRCTFKDKKSSVYAIINKSMLFLTNFFSLPILPYPFLYIFWRARVCWPLLCLSRPFYDF
jgi:hypothetical protein